MARTSYGTLLRKLLDHPSADRLGGDGVLRFARFARVAIEAGDVAEIIRFGDARGCLFRHLGDLARHLRMDEAQLREDLEAWDWLGLLVWLEDGGGLGLAPPFGLSPKVRSARLNGAKSSGPRRGADAPRAGNAEKTDRPQQRGMLFGVPGGLAGTHHRDRNWGPTQGSQTATHPHYPSDHPTQTTDGASARGTGTENDNDDDHYHHHYHEVREDSGGSLYVREPEPPPVLTSQPAYPTEQPTAGVPTGVPTEVPVDAAKAVVDGIAGIVGGAWRTPANMPDQLRLAGQWLARPGVSVGLILDEVRRAVGRQALPKEGVRTISYFDKPLGRALAEAASRPAEPPPRPQVPLDPDTAHLDEAVRRDVQKFRELAKAQPPVAPLEEYLDDPKLVQTPIDARLSLMKQHARAAFDFVLEDWATRAPPQSRRAASG